MAERQGFEPWEGCPSTVFKTAAFDHSATSPQNPALYPGNCTALRHDSPLWRGARIPESGKC
jgi:hypothetical protein